MKKSDNEKAEPKSGGKAFVKMEAKEGEKVPLKAKGKAKAKMPAFMSKPR